MMIDFQGLESFKYCKEKAPVNNDSILFTNIATLPSSEGQVTTNGTVTRDDSYRFL